MNDTRMRYLAVKTFRDLTQKRHVPGTARQHAEAAMRWLCKAQDACADGGISAGYDLLRDKWLPAYPEVTGYSIPTFYDYDGYSGDRSMRERALRMAAWESSIQLPCGAVGAGNLGAKERVPAVFDTGQVIFGWVRAYEETSQPAFIHSAEKAADWLCDIQDDDGAWRAYPAPQVRNTLNVYNTRVAWALIKAYVLLKKEEYREAARKNVAWALTQQNERGWFNNNDFSTNEKPLTHTIAYAIEGILEAGMYLHDDTFINSAVRACDAIVHEVKEDGFLKGRYDRNWIPRSGWSCLAGNAQIAVVLLKLYRWTGTRLYLDIARTITASLKTIHEISVRNTSINGGVGGSYPIFGAYERYRYPSWAAKFFVDALLLEETVAGNIC